MGGQHLLAVGEHVWLLSTTIGGVRVPSEPQVWPLVSLCPGDPWARTDPAGQRSMVWFSGKTAERRRLLTPLGGLCGHQRQGEQARGVTGPDLLPSVKCHPPWGWHPNPPGAGAPHLALPRPQVVDSLSGPCTPAHIPALGRGKICQGQSDKWVTSHTHHITAQEIGRQVGTEGALRRPQASQARKVTSQEEIGTALQRKQPCSSL